jgi:hypothetical protein
MNRELKSMLAQSWCELRYPADMKRLVMCSIDAVKDTYTLKACNVETARVSQSSSPAANPSAT